MTYVPTSWQDLPNTSTAITAARLNNMEAGIVAASALVVASSGLLSARPVASANTNYFYYATDQAVLYFTDGASWMRMSTPAGALVDWMEPSATVPTGWVAYDGTTLPASTGIYADLYAHLGSTTTLPDTRGRVTAAKGTNADMTAIGGTEGAVLASRRVKHGHPRNGTIALTGANSTLAISGSNSTIGLSGSNSSIGFSAGSVSVITGASLLGVFNTTGSGTAWSGGSYQSNGTGGSLTGGNSSIGLSGANSTIGLSGANSTIALSDTMTVGQQTNAPTDAPAYIVTLKIAKL